MQCGAAALASDVIEHSPVPVPAPFPSLSQRGARCCWLFEGVNRRCNVNNSQLYLIVIVIVIVIVIAIVIVIVIVIGTTTTSTTTALIECKLSVWFCFCFCFRFRFISLNYFIDLYWEYLLIIGCACACGGLDWVVGASYYMYIHNIFDRLQLIFSFALRS